MRAVCTPYTLPLLRPMRTSQTLRVAREGFWLALLWPNGLFGLGEAAGWPGFGGGEHAVSAARAVVERALMLAGPNIAPPPPVLGHERAGAFAWVQDALGTICAHADTPLPVEWRHAIETALCDAASQQSGLPLCQWLSPNASLEVAVHAQVQSAAEAADAVRAGAQHLKLKIGHRSRDDDGAHVAGVRAAVGDDVGLRLDANGAWGQAIAERVACMLAAAQPEWIEQPCPAGDIEALMAVGRTSRVPVAVDEGLSSPEALHAHLTAKAAAVYVLKPMFLGGPLETLRAARSIAAAGADVCMTHAIESCIGTNTAGHVAAAVHATLPPERIRAAGLRLMVQDPHARPHSSVSSIVLPSAAGLGVPISHALAN